MITRRRLLQYTAATTALSALPFDTFAAEKLTIWGPPVSPTVLLAVAAEMGEARKIRPFNVKSWKNPDQLRAGLVNKTIQMSIVPNYVAANLRAQGQPVVLYNIMTTGIMQMMSRHAALTDLKQLEGKKLVMPFKNDMPDLVLQILAKKHNVNLENVVTYTATPPEAVTLFLQKEFDYALLPEPIASASVLKGKQLGINVEYGLSPDRLWSATFKTQHGLMVAGLMVTEEVYKQDAEFLRLLNKDIENAIEWVKNNPKSAAEIAANYIPAPIPALERGLPNSNLTALRTAEVKEELLGFLTALYELNPKITGGKKPDASLFGL